ncbi:hypothetical protein [Nocardia wallacei]|uniref:hypothetical protein n=1 Tax=Nocardia wallacei TaxID=480035 RepID=UPI0024570954|nr:hypothetical protein [Nocardia wallacei]
MKRADYERMAADTGWTVEVRGDATVFGRNGWRIEASWLDDRNVLARLAVTDPYGQPGESMNWIDHREEIDEELRRQLESPGPLRDPHVPLEKSIARLLYLMQKVAPHRPFTAGWIAEKLQGCLEDSGIATARPADDEPTTGDAEDYARDRWIDEQTGVS